MYICDFKGCQYAGTFQSVFKHEKICPFNPKRMAEHDGLTEAMNRRQEGERMEMYQMDKGMHMGRQAQVNGEQMEAVRKEEQQYPETGEGKGAHDGKQPSPAAEGVPDAEGKDNSNQPWVEPFMTR